MSAYLTILYFLLKTKDIIFRQKINFKKKLLGERNLS